MSIMRPLGPRAPKELDRVMSAMARILLHQQGRLELTEVEYSSCFDVVQNALAGATPEALTFPRRQRGEP